MGPESGFTRDIYMPAEILSSASQSKDVWTRGISTVKDVGASNFKNIAHAK
jgi:hypothetical protein